MASNGAPGEEDRPTSAAVGESERWAAPPTGEVEGLVRSLVGMMRSGGITELDLAFGAVTVRLRGGTDGAVPEMGGEAPVDEAPAAPPAEEGSLITAPMIGTFYAAPSPGAPPFVEVGDAVEIGQVVGIIEAMKIMNEIVADRAGVVGALLVGNGQPVEYGSALIRFLPAAPE